MRQQCAVAVVGLIAAVQISACHVTSDPAAVEKSQEATFLDILYGPIRDKYSDSVLIAEGRKACDAFGQGQSQEQVQQLVATDLALDPGLVSQFMGAIYGGLDCGPK